jgi:methionyl-tRNA formyltransferase
VKVVLLGSSRPAVVALEALSRSGAEIVGVGAHAGETETAVEESLLATARGLGLRTAEFDAAHRDEIDRFVRSARPDIGLTVGFRFLLAPTTLHVPGHGWLNLHSSLLPAYRGRAPVNWAILEGERELGATLHVIDEGVDTGDVVYQERFELADDEDVADALRKLDVAYTRLIEKALAAARQGQLPRTPMPAGETRVWPRRTPDDGEIDWNRPAAEIVRLVRAVAPPYPGAFTRIPGRRLYVYKARVGEELVAPAPGLIVGPHAISAADAAVEPLLLAIEEEGRLEELDGLEPYVGTVCGG